MSEVSAIDGAAAAFQAEINPNYTPRGDSVRNDAPVERMFGNLDNNFEGGEDAGDDTSIEPKIVPKRNGKPPRADVVDRHPSEEEDDGDGEEELGDDVTEGNDGDDTEGDDNEVEEEEGDEDETPEAKAFYDTKVEITVDGKVEDVSVREALNGYIRQQTFHRRMNQVNEAATQVGAAAKEVASNRDRYEAMNADLEATLKELMPAEPDWDKLFVEDPAGAHKLKKDYDAYKGKLATLQSNREAAMKERQAETAKQTEAFAHSEFAKFIENNKIESPEILKKEIASMRKTGLAAGFTEEEIATVYDSRMMTILRKASKYDRMMAAKPKAVIPDKGKTLVPGNGKSSNGSTVRNGYGQAARNLARTGSVDDAAAYFRKFTR